MKWSAAFAFATLAVTATAQNWKAIGRGTVNNWEVQTLYGDPVSDRLLAGGPFKYIINTTDTVLGMGQAAWNGTRWDSLATRIAPAEGQTYWFQRFQGDLYSCGNYIFDAGGGVGNTSFARLNEETQRWEALECINPASSSLDQLVQRTPGASSLYATGYAESLCGYPTACVYRYDGNAFYEWEPWGLIPPAPDNGDYVAYVFDFQGYTYMTGGFQNPNGNGIRYFMRYNGSAWEDVPGWGNAYHIRDVHIQDDVLYVCGTFKQSTGAPGNLIAAFDGQNWSDMGGGLTYLAEPGGSTARTLEWHDGNLYVGGTFDHAGGQALNGGLAIWNGSTWSGLPGAFHTAHPLVPELAILWDITFWRDSLYICGGFDGIDGEEVKKVAQYLGPLPGAVGVHEAATPEHQLQLVPLGNGSEWAVWLPTGGPWQLQVYDAAGRCVNEAANATNRHELNLAAAASGLYVVRAANNRGEVLHGKLVKP